MKLKGKENEMGVGRERTGLSSSAITYEPECKHEEEKEGERERGKWPVVCFAEHISLKAPT